MNSHLLNRVGWLPTICWSILIPALLAICSTQVNAQMLKRVALSKAERNNGFFMKFGYYPKDDFADCGLVLKKDGTYTYWQHTCLSGGRSEGRWTVRQRILTLESTLQQDNISVLLSDDDGAFVDSLKIAIVRNSRNEALHDVFVLVNHDTVRCLPTIGLCVGTFEKISRVKVVFENGMSSAWIPVEAGRNRVSLVVQTEEEIASYVVMHNRKFKVKGRYLIYL
ncbi:hypothetical protein HGH92_05200 [Chitinophaga varians]|uniref:Uncharacterized protein n=1 Tax=Chitinophaga varians TaxID=2202339 RepID=A0A847RS29_9BACT|nr:hypothetical protein [Chitinophaga varians]NLR63698.1 hypothetical protein [Chitinophaga varians]